MLNKTMNVVTGIAIASWLVSLFYCLVFLR